jgi:hypothetical protein
MRFEEVASTVRRSLPSTPSIVFPTWWVMSATGTLMLLTYLLVS